MNKNNNHSHKHLCISNNQHSRRSNKKLFSSVITPKNSKTKTQKRTIGSPKINYVSISKNNSKSSNTINNTKRNKSLEKENLKVLKINNVSNCINTTMKVIKIVSSPSINSINTLNNTINNTINNNINAGLRKNKTSIDFEDLSSSNNMLFNIINRYKEENNTCNELNKNYIRLNNNNLPSNKNIANNQLIIPTKTYYGSPKNDLGKKTMNYRMENFQYKSFNKRHEKLKNYLKKTFKEKCESKRLANYNEINKTTNLGSKKMNKSKSKNVFSHQKSNSLMKASKNKYLSQSQTSSNLGYAVKDKIISKNNIDFKQPCLHSFIYNRKNSIENERKNNSLFTKREDDKNNIEIDVKENTEEIKEKENIDEEINNNIKELKNTLISKIQDLEKEKNDMNLKIQELNKQNEQLIKTINDKENIIKNYIESNINEKDKYDKIVNNHNRQICDFIKEIKDLKTNNNMLNNKVINLNKEKNNLKNEIHFKNGEYLDLMAKKKEISNMLLKSREKNEKSNNEVKKLMKENNELKNRVNNFIRNIDDYKQKNDNFQLKIEDYKNEIMSLYKANGDLLIDLESKKNIINELSSKIDILNNDKKYLEIEQNDKRNESETDNNNDLFEEKSKEKNIKSCINKFQIIQENNFEYIKNEQNKNYVYKTEIKRYKKSKTIIPSDDYSLIKTFIINNNLRWYLFKRKSKIKDKNNSFDDISQNEYKKYKWVSNNSIDNINDFKNTSIQKSAHNSSNKKDTNIVYRNNNFIKLLNDNKEFNKQNKKLIKSNTENGLIGLSFINQDEREISNFLDDYGFEDILNDLGDTEFNNNTKNYNIYNIHNNNNKIYFNTPKKYYPNNINNYSKNNKTHMIYKKENVKKIQKSKLIKTIDVLLKQIQPNSKIMKNFSSMLKQLGCLDKDIFELIGNYNCSDSVKV